jgi:hypothetical protein
MARLKGSRDKKDRKIRNKKLTCSKGHDIAVVGRNSSGNCKKCRYEYDAVRREFIRKYFNEKPS